MKMFDERRGKKAGKGKTDCYGNPVLVSLLRLVTAFIPGTGRRKRVRRAWINRVQHNWLARFLPKWRRHLAELETRCGEKLARGEKLRVAFLVLDVSMFSAEPIFARMAEGGPWEPFIVIIPDRLRDPEFARARAEKAFALLTKRYPGKVSCFEGKIEADLAFTSNPYPDQSDLEVSARELGKTTLVLYIPYSYGGHLLAPARRLVMRPEMSLFWRSLAANPAGVKLWAEANPFLRENSLAVGYPKSDRLASIPRKAEPGVKTVILSPHHSINKESDGLTLSNFLRYADFFQKLPEEYQALRFVFRPHPLLKERLSRPQWWGPEKTEAWFAAMARHPNVVCQDGGDYFETFVNADALIHDCGSFLPEYFFTRHPQCFLLKDEAQLETEFSSFGRDLLKRVHTAYDEAGIRRFLDRVVIAGEDDLRDERDRYAQDEVCIHYPHSSEWVIELLLKRLGDAAKTPMTKLDGNAK